MRNEAKWLNVRDNVKVCMKEEKNEVKKRKVEDEIMMKDTRNMDLEQNEYIRLHRLEILERLKSKFPS